MIPEGSLPENDPASLPGWLFDLKKLAPIATTLVTVAKNPIQFLRGPVLEIVIRHFILRPAAWVYGYVLQAVDIVQDAILTLPPILKMPILWITDPLIGVINTLYGSVRGVMMSLGLGAPLAGAVAVAIALVVILTIAYAIYKLVPGTDALEGVTQWTS